MRPSKPWMRRRRHVLLGLAAVLVALSLPSLGPTLAHASGDALYNRAGGKCLESPSGTKGTHLILYACNGGSNQDWYQIDVNDFNQTELFQNARYPSMCLDVYGDSSKNYTPAVIWPCNSSDPAQIMFFGPYWDNYYFYQAGSGTCLDDYHSGTGNGNAIEFYSCNNTYAQQWEPYWT